MLQELRRINKSVEKRTTACSDNKGVICKLHTSSSKTHCDTINRVGFYVISLINIIPILISSILSPFFLHLHIACKMNFSADFHNNLALDSKREILREPLYNVKISLRYSSEDHAIQPNQ